MTGQTKTILDTTCVRLKRAVIYARVSTDEQAKGYSLSTQVEACEKYAGTHGFEVIAVFQDDYTGTKPIEQRPEGRKAYDLLASSAADVLIAYRVDRIVRPPEEGDEWEMPILIRGLAKLGRDIHTVNRGQLKTDFASLLIAMLDAKGAGDERRALLERTMRGRDKKLALGKVIRAPKSPYGYTYEGDTLAIDETEAAIVRTIYQWYIKGDDGTREPMTDYAITHRLSEMGIPTPGEKKPCGKPRLRDSGMWTYGTVRRILINETYAGVYRFGKTGTYHKGAKRERRPVDEQFVIQVPPIVSREVWEAAQLRRSHNKHISGKKRYLLRGIITCGCGRKMAGKHKKPCRYTCSVDKTFLKGLEDQRFNCHEKPVDGDVLETAVWNYVVSVLTDLAFFEKEWRKAQRKEQDLIAPKRARLEAVIDMLQQCEHEAAELAEALKHARGLVLANLQSNMDSLDSRYAKLMGERDRLSADVQAGSKLTDDALARALRFRADILDGLKHPTFDDKRLYLELLDVRVTVQEGRAIIRCALPIDPYEIVLAEQGLTFVQFRVYFRAA